MAQLVSSILSPKAHGHTVLAGYRERSEAKADARKSEEALRKAVGKNQVYARKVFYALNRWHASWQLMDGFQRWVTAMRLRRVRCVCLQASSLLSHAAANGRCILSAVRCKSACIMIEHSYSCCSCSSC